MLLFFIFFKVVAIGKISTFFFFFLQKINKDKVRSRCSAKVIFKQCVACVDNRVQMYVTLFSVC